MSNNPFWASGKPMVPNEANVYWCNGKPYVALCVNAGAVLKEVSDALSLTDTLFCNKTLSLIDGVAAWENILHNKPGLVISDAVSLADLALTPSRALQALDAVGVSDNVLIQKLLVINENISLAEIAEAGVGGFRKTRLFLILGDLAIQLSGD